MNNWTIYQRFIKLFEDETSAREELKTVRDDIKQFRMDAIEHGHSDAEIDNIALLAKAHVKGDDESVIEDARGLLSTARSLDLYGMGAVDAED